MEFLDLLHEHKALVNSKMNIIIIDLIKRSQVHDDDKIFNQKIYNVYKEHFPNLKSIEFGTKEYKNYEYKYFDQAHQLHAQNRHHYYSPRNNDTAADLNDLIEAIVDIAVSNMQYSNESNIDRVMSVLKNKGIMDISLEQYVKNTLIKLCEEHCGKDFSSRR